jgi:hypothetical protein
MDNAFNSSHSNEALKNYYKREIDRVKERLKNNYGNADFHLEEITIFNRQLQKLNEGNR